MFSNYLVVLDSGSRDAVHRSSGMTVYLHCDAATGGRGKLKDFVTVFLAPTPDVTDGGFVT